MPVYVVRDPDSGRQVRLTGDAPPSAGELDRIFKHVDLATQMDQARGETTSTLGQVGSLMDPTRDEEYRAQVEQRYGDSVPITTIAPSVAMPWPNPEAAPRIPASPGAGLIVLPRAADVRDQPPQGVEALLGDKGAAMLRGVGNVAAGFAEFPTSTLGMATSGAGALGNVAQAPAVGRVVAGAYAGDMLWNLPGVAEQTMSVAANPDSTYQQKVEALTGLLGQGAIGLALARHAVLGGRPLRVVAADLLDRARVRPTAPPSPAADAHAAPAAEPAEPGAEPVPPQAGPAPKPADPTLQLPIPRLQQAVGRDPGVGEYRVTDDMSADEVARAESAAQNQIDRIWPLLTPEERQAMDRGKGAPARARYLLEGEPPVPPALLTPAEHAQMVATREGINPQDIVGFSADGMPLLRAGSPHARTVPNARRSILDALEQRTPINAALFDGYNATSPHPIPLPPDYVRIGDQFQPKGGVSGERVSQEAQGQEVLTPPVLAPAGAGQVQSEAGTSKVPMAGTTSEAPVEVPVAAWGGDWQAATPNENVKVGGRYAVVDERNVVTSFDPGYDASLQPRDRTRQASQNQIASLVQALEPQRLGESFTTDMGSPIVDARNHVLSGNGRSAALRTLYQAGQGEAYKQWLVLNAERFGLDPAQISQLERPVLVRRVQTYGNLSPQEFARQSNAQQILGQSEAEAATADARLLRENPGLLDAFLPDDTGNVLAASNRPFLNAFIQGTGAQAELLSRDGYHGPALTRRVKNAILGALLGPENRTLIGHLIEQADELNLKNVVNGTMAVAGRLVKLRGTAYDLGETLHRALSDLVSLLRSGEKLEDFLGQGSLFGDPSRTAEGDLLLMALHRTRSAKELVDLLNRYERAAREAILDQQSGGLFGQQQPAQSLADIIRRITNERTTQARQGGLFEQASPGPGESAAEPRGPDAARGAEEPAPGRAAEGGGGTDRGTQTLASPAPTGGAEPSASPPPPADDPLHSVFHAMPMEMPEAVQFVKELTGTFPRIAERLRALKGQAAGVFIHTDGPDGKGRVELRSDLFDLLSPQEKREILDRAEEFARSIESNPERIKRVAAKKYREMLAEAYRLARERNPVAAMKVMWHEIGHLVDWLPDRIIRGRGNILGHLAALKRFTSHALPIDPDQPMGPALTHADMARLRRESAEALARELGALREIVETITVEEPIYRELAITPDMVKRLFGMDAREALPELYRWFASQSAEVKKEIVRAAMKGMVDERLQAVGGRERIGTRTVTREVRRTETRHISPEEFERRFRQKLREEMLRRNRLDLKTIKAELEPAIAWWRGTEQMEPYFRPPAEMYAEAFSIFANNPAAAAQRAPFYSRVMWNYLDRRPEVKELYDKIQDRIRTGRVMGDRVANLRRMFADDDKRSLDLDRMRNKLTGRDWIDNVRYHIDRRFGPIYRLTRGYAREGAVKEAIGSFLYRATEHERLLGQWNDRVAKPLVAANLDWADLGEHQFHKRISEERINLANPQGWTPKNSLERLREMQQTLGPERWNTLVRAAEEFRKVYDEGIVRPLKAARMFNPQLQEAINSRVHYVTFSPVKEGQASGIEAILQTQYGSAVTPHIYRQIGMLGEIKNPATATVLKALGLATSMLRNTAKREIVRLITAQEPEGIAPAEMVWNGRYQEPKIVDTPRVGTIVYLDEGKVRAFYVRKVLADAINFGNPHENLIFAQLREATGWLKGLLTQLNYAFWPVNFVRDSVGWMAQMPGGGPIAWAKVLPQAALAARQSVTRSRPNPYAEAALKRKMVISASDPRGTWAASDNEFDLRVARMGLNPAAWDQAGKQASKLMRAWQWYRELGQSLERVNKIAGMIHLDERYPQMPEWKKREIVRERAGSPDFLQRGASNPYVDLVAMFYNPWKEGVRSVVKAAAENPVAFGSKAAIGLLIPSVIQAAAVNGWMGDELKRRYRSVPDYDLTNYLVVPPLWADRDMAKVAYVRLPLWEPARVAHGVLFQMLTDRGEGITSFAGGQLPGLNPMLAAVMAWVQYTMGQNPQDIHRGVGVLSENQQRARVADGGPALREMLKWTWNQLGGSVLYRFRSQNLESPPAGAGEQILALPGVNNLIGRWVKVSDRGVFDEVRRDVTNPIAAHEASMRLGVQEIVRKIQAGEMLGESERMLLRDPGALRYFASQWKRAGLGQEPPWQRILQSATTRQQKLGVLKYVTETKP